ncbi:DNA mismatch endonuclease Vsr [Tissierella creatinini]|nr:DNA mismatch endonuclease Vsr [Tissierella creatinini]TJX66369.1 DNA mismatch endonuclease Vsr [Soehngenia saccharolytica]
MADVFSKDKRSEIMAKIRGKDTKIEMVVRKWIFAHGFRYRKNDKRFPGTPDIVLPKYKTVIFINGCFWHGHEHCKLSHMPKSNVEYWEHKISRNIENDIKNQEDIKMMGWNFIIVWECQLKENTEEVLENLIEKIEENKGHKSSRL